MQYEYLHLRQAKEDYVLCLHSKYNFIVGESGSGKTFLKQILENRKRGVTTSYSGFAPLIRYTEFTSLLAGGNPDPEAIVFLDETDIVDQNWRDVVKILQKSKSWFIIAKRDLPADLAYGVYDIFRIQRNKHTRAMVPYFDFSLANHSGAADRVQHTIAEDSKTGL